MMTDEMPFTHPFQVAGLSARKPTRFRLTPDATERDRIAQALGLLDLSAVSLVGELRPAGRRDWELEATLTARAVQACIVTLAPVPAVISEAVRRRYLSEMPEPAGEDVEMPEDDSVEPLEAVIDAGFVLTEALTLALPPYPRAEGAALGALQVAPPGAESLSEETVRPFAGLADLLRTPDTDKT